MREGCSPARFAGSQGVRSLNHALCLVYTSSLHSTSKEFKPTHTGPLNYAISPDK